MILDESTELQFSGKINFSEEDGERREIEELKFNKNELNMKKD